MRIDSGSGPVCASISHAAPNLMGAGTRMGSQHGREAPCY